MNEQVKVRDLIERVSNINIESVINVFDNLDNMSNTDVKTLEDSVTILDNTICDIKELEDTLNVLNKIDINYTTRLDTNHYGYINSLEIKFKYNLINISIREESKLYKMIKDYNDDILKSLVKALEEIKNINQNKIDIINSSLIVLDCN